MKLGREEISEIVKSHMKSVGYDTRDWTVEIVLQKFNRKVEDENRTEVSIPFYQREFVWNDEQIARLVETILLGLPLPLIFLEQTQTCMFEIIDGSQRIRALDKFFRNEKKLCKLKILEKLNGLKFGDLPSAVQRQLNNYSLRIIVLQPRGEDEADIAANCLTELIQAEQIPHAWS
ncbi:hypothetical protein NHP22001_13500 [Helicobacter sp. NHP22-001]|nr:hypothetical protein NHP22001_13500 [Helicobacter sp. NHP22-001]